jgi:hypothetical protein
MRIAQVRIITSALSKEIGWTWPLFLARCLVAKRTVFGNTRWARSKEPEAQYVKRLSLAVAIYSALSRRKGRERAFEVTRRMLVPIGCGEQWGHLRSLRPSESEPMRQLMAFNDLMDKKGAPRFNKREYLKPDADTCHFVITRCVFHDFFAEAGVPELTRLFCEVDREFFPFAFPAFTFHRGDSWENTIAFGKDHCEFIFERCDLDDHPEKQG